jgi:hypothetical protein
LAAAIRLGYEQRLIATIDIYFKQGSGSWTERTEILIVGHFWELSPHDAVFSIAVTEFEHRCEPAAVSQDDRHLFADEFGILQREP